MTHLVDCMGYLLKTLRGAGVALFDSAVAPLFTQFLAAGQPPSLRHNAICLYDDMIEYGGAGAQKYLTPVVPVLVANLEAEEPELRQASVYGLMQVAKVWPEAYRTMHADVTPRLVALATRPDAAEDEHELVTENCVSALG